jgi:hypothetical protein
MEEWNDGRMGKRGDILFFRRFNFSNIPLFQHPNFPNRSLAGEVMWRDSGANLAIRLRGIG